MIVINTKYSTKTHCRYGCILSEYLNEVIVIRLNFILQNEMNEFVFSLFSEFYSRYEDMMITALHKEFHLCFGFNIGRLFVCFPFY